MNKRFILLLLIFFLSICSCVYATGNDANTVSLLHMNGADQSTTFTDDAAGGTHSWTAYLGAQIDTAQKEFGTASGLFDGVDSYISTGDSADWNFGAGNFTIDFWVRFNSLTAYDVFITQYQDAENEWVLRRDDTTNQLYFYCNVPGATIIEVPTSGLSLNVNTWYHIALVRNGSNFQIYVDGVSYASVTDTSDMPDFTGSLYIGMRGNLIHHPFDGWLDEVRVSKGIARWTANFTPPTEEYNGAVGQVIMISSD